MKKLEELDPNLLGANVRQYDLEWHNGRSEPFVICGACLEESAEQFCRIPRAVAAATSEGVRDLNEKTAGVRLRFRTDSTYIAIHATQATSYIMPHMAQIGHRGFDMYADGVFGGCYRPSLENMLLVEDLAGFDENDRRMRSIEINFPLYNDIKEVYIGLSRGAKIEAPLPYRHTVPVLYYGSSITQGGCASRPGLCYQAHISRWFDTDYRNLGYSGNARGEQVMADYIAAQPMSAFVLDYDHNAPTLEHLRNTHEKFFRTVREAQPDLPVVIVTRPDANLQQPSFLEDVKRRREVIFATYRHAVDAGDRNVYFVDGQTFYPDALRDSCSVDYCHPNDLGFFLMAAGIAKPLRRILGEVGQPLAAHSPELIAGTLPALGDVL